ncbi:MAG: shikimate kinase [Acidimicrobiia bacterium]
MISLSGRHLVLTGPMASGKTTLGRILARRLDRPFIDSDEQITDRFGMTSSELAAAHGVDSLHESEARALIEALTEEEPAVIAAAASVADSPQAMSALSRSDALVVLVEAPVDLLLGRLTEDGHRRPISADEFAALTRDRRETLLGLPPASVVDTSRQEPEESAEHVLRLLRGTK